MTVQDEARLRPKGRRVTLGARGWLPLLLFPICLGLGVVYFSAVQGLGLGFTEWNLLSAPTWVGFGNFAAILGDDKFWHALTNTFQIVVLTVPAKVVIGLALAVLLHRVVKGSSFFRLALFFPATCSIVSVAYIWTYLYDPDGLLNKVLVALGLPAVAWMAPDRALLSVSTMIVWAGVGYVALLFVAGLQSIPQELYEASRIDGAGPFQQFRLITLPLLTPTTFFVTITSMIAALQTFGEVYILKGKVDSTLTILAYVYEKAFGDFQMGYASALSMFLILVILLVTVLQLRLQRRLVNYDV